MFLRASFIVMLLTVAASAFLFGQASCSPCTPCDSSLQKLLNNWNNQVSNANEVKFVGFSRKMEVTGENASTLEQLLTNESTYAGYCYYSGTQMRVWIALLRDMYSKRIKEVFNADTTVLSFASREDYQLAAHSAVTVSSTLYELTFHINGKLINMPALCSKEGVLINHLLFQIRMSVEKTPGQL